MRLFLFALVVLVLLLAPAPAAAAPPAQSHLPLCFFQIVTDDWRLGFYVCDDSIPMRTEFYRLGFDPGYPVSRRYQRGGYVEQAFQKTILQWRPELVRAVPVNIFDELHNMGRDAALFQTRQVPYQLPDGWDAGAPFPDVIRRRQALLDARPAMRRAYFSVRDPMHLFGLPTSEVADMGNHYAIRLQRAVLQEWKEDVPWARRGQVTIANGGDIAKEFGLIPEAFLARERTPYIPNIPGAPNVPGIPRGTDGPTPAFPAPALPGPISPPPTTPRPGPGGYTGPYDPNGPDRNCSDFATQSEAQAFFIAAGGPARDPHRLDADNDGQACEELPR